MSVTTTTATESTVSPVAQTTSGSMTLSNLTQLASDMSHLSDQVLQGSGAVLYAYLTLPLVLLLVAALLPTKMKARLMPLLGTAVMFILVPAMIIVTSVEMAVRKTDTMFGIGIFELVVLTFALIYSIVKSTMLYIKTGSWRSFVWGTDAILVVKTNSGNHYFSGAINPTGLAVNIGWPKAGHACICTSTGTHCMPVPTLAQSPASMMYCTPVNCVLLTRVDQAINAHTSNTEAGVVYYQPTKRMAGRDRQTWLGREEDMLNLLM